MRVTLVMALVGLSVACKPPRPAVVDPLPVRGIGVRYGATPDAIAEYEAWLGREMDVVLVFFDGDSPGEVVRNGARIIDNWTGSKYETVVFSTPLAFDGQTLRQVARGANDDMFERLARLLVSADRGDDVIRLGWELNLDNFAWSALGDPEAYARAFRRAVDVMRAVPGASKLRFEWNFGRGGEPVDERAYPGDDYVDIVGMDVYDRSASAAHADPIERWERYATGNPGFDWLAAFAAAHGKPIALSEWGLSTSHVDGVSGDNPYFIEKVREFIDIHEVAYAIYFERDVRSANHRLIHFPVAAAKYLELFG